MQIIVVPVRLLFCSWCAKPEVWKSNKHRCFRQISRKRRAGASTSNLDTEVSLYFPPSSKLMNPLLCFLRKTLILSCTSYLWAVVLVRRVLAASSWRCIGSVPRRPQESPSTTPYPGQGSCPWQGPDRLCWKRTVGTEWVQRDAAEAGLDLQRLVLGCIDEFFIKSIGFLNTGERDLSVPHCRHGFWKSKL